MTNGGPGAIERMRGVGDVDGLLALLQHSDDVVVVSAAETLAELNEKQAVDPLLRLLRVVNPRSRLRKWESLAGSLAELATPGSASADYLLSFVVKEEFWCTTESGGRSIAMRAAWMLSAMDDQRFIEVLLRRLHMTAPGDATEETLWEWTDMAEILARNNAVEAVEPLAAVLSVASPAQQEFLVEALCELGDPRAIPGLIAALEAHHGSYNLGLNDIAVALGEFGTPEALHAIRSYEDSLPKQPPSLISTTPNDSAREPPTSPKKRVRSLVDRLRGARRTPSEVYYSDSSIEDRCLELLVLYRASRDRASSDEIERYLRYLAIEEESWRETEASG